MEQILLFFAETGTMIYIIKNIFHTEYIKEKRFQILSGILMISYIFYCLLSYRILPYSIFTIAIIFLIFQEKWQIKVCWSAIYLLSFNIISNSIFHSVMAFTHTNPENHILNYLSSLLGILIIFLTSLILHHKFFKESRPFEKLDWQGYLLIAFVLLVDFFLTNTAYFLIHDELNSFGKSTLILSIFVMIIMSIVLLILYFRLQMLHTELQEKDQLNQEMLRLEENHYKELQKKNLDLRAFRHDYNYHVTSLRALAEKEDFKALKQYIETLSDIKEQIQYLSTGQPISFPKRKTGKFFYPFFRTGKASSFR